MENEVFKTNHLVNYASTDIIGKCVVLFLKDYVRGKPAGFDIKDVYVCESRYIEPSKTFAKIKTWATCLPEKAKDREIKLELYDAPLVPNRVNSIWHEAVPEKRKRKSVPLENDVFASSSSSPASKVSFYAN